MISSLQSCTRLPSLLPCILALSTAIASLLLCVFHPLFPSPVPCAPQDGLGQGARWAQQAGMGCLEHLLPCSR